MEELADTLKTRSLSAALESLTEQVLEISSLTIKDLQEQPHLKESLEHLSEGIRLSTKQLCEILAKKFKTLQSSTDTCDAFKEALVTAEEAAAYSLWLTADETSLEDFQEKIAGLLEVVLKLFVFWDQEIVRNFQDSIINLRKPLQNIRKTQFLHEIISSYKEFVTLFGDFSRKLSLRIGDLIDNKIQNEFWIHLNCIQKLITSFAEVVKNIACYPLSKHSRISKEFVVKELLSLLDELDQLLSLKQVNDSVRDGTSFIGAIDDVLEHLERSHFDDEEMGWRIQLILQHSMTVSKFSSEHDRVEITRNSQRTLNEYRSLQSTLKNLENSPSDISLAIDIFRDFLELLEQSVNHSLLRMMVENLSICTEPIRRLIHRCPLGMNESAESRATSDLTREVEEFDNVMERVLQTCFFALSSTADLPKIQIIRCALKLLESLEAEMVPAIFSCYLDPTNKSAACHLQFLWRSFREHCEHMQASLDSIADSIAFCHVAEKVLTNHVMELRKNLYIQDVELLESHCRPITTITSRCLAIVELQEWGKMFGSKLYLQEIHLALREFQGATRLMVDNVSDLSSHRSMLKRAELVLKYLVKSVDAMKQMQDSNLPLEETLMNEVHTPPSVMLFPDDVINLPCDPTKNEHSTTMILSNSTRIGRLPKRKIQNLKSFSEAGQDFSEMSRFIDTTQPWRTRSTMLLLQNDSQVNVHQRDDVSENVETFDLTDVLEELSTLDGTLTSTKAKDLSISSAQGSPYATLTKATPSSANISTPQRLRDLQIVSERLARLRKHNNNI